jgi:hypothetical protein
MAQFLGRTALVMGATESELADAVRSSMRAGPRFLASSRRRRTHWGQSTSCLNAGIFPPRAFTDWLVAGGVTQKRDPDPVSRTSRAASMLGIIVGP